MNFARTCYTYVWTTEHIVLYGIDAWPLAWKLYPKITTVEMDSQFAYKTK